MSQFLTGQKLNESIYQIIWNAEKTLVLVSPFIRLDDYFRKLLLKHVNEPALQIIVIFGKNEGQINKSLKKDDFDFLCQFPNISIIYSSNLHGKYYGNEKAGVITSINLHDHSFDNNIEFGIFQEQTLLDSLRNSTDKAAWDYCLEIAKNGLPVFIKRPAYQKNILSILIGKNYVKSEILLDYTNKFYSNFFSLPEINERLDQFPHELDFKSTPGPMPEKEMPIKTQKSNQKTFNRSTPKTGFCIRTGIEIPYDPTKPFSYDAYREWVEYENYDYPEKYCHKTGEKTHGTNSFRYPILNEKHKNTKHRSNTLTDTWKSY